MYLRCNRRIKDGKEHRYWNIVESKRCSGGKEVQRQVLYLGEINDSQRESWCRVIEAFDEKRQQRTQLALFPAEKELPEYAEGYGVRVHLEAMELCRPRQFGACWLACHSMSNWPSISSGKIVCLIVVRGRVGSMCFRPWYVTG
jgi:hypothetical protein